MFQGIYINKNIKERTFGQAIKSSGDYKIECSSSFWRYLMEQIMDKKVLEKAVTKTVEYYFKGLSFKEAITKVLEEIGEN